MPFVEGESLRDRLRREKQLPVDEALRIAREAADALDYAHRHGVIHRDIKPENILLHDGRPIVADFGIALALSAAAGGRMTETGMSLGTPHYMSPEQATAEKEITGRSDIYSLGSVLYEMLAGEPPHIGHSAQQIIMKIIAEEVQPVTKHRKAVPPNVAAAVAKSLERLPADRFATAKEFADALGNTAFSTVATSAGGAVAPALVRLQRWLLPLALAVALVVGLAAGRVVWRAPRPMVTRLALALPDDQRLAPLNTGLRLAISPDGRRLVYPGPGEGGVQLWLRDLSQLAATPIPGTTGASTPFFSPDGTRLGYFGRNGFELRVQGLDGGVPLTLVPSGNTSGGGVWGNDGFIYYDTIDGLKRIPENGGSATIAAPLDSTKQDVGHAYPDITPNSRGLIYRLRRAGEDPRSYRLVVTDLRTGVQKELIQGLVGRYVAPGYLVYVTLAGDLLAAPFDQDKLEITGSSVPLLQGIATGGLGAADVVISRTGDLLYVSGKVQSALTLATVDRGGRATQVDLGATGNGVPNALALSPDGKNVALSMVDGRGSQDIWVKSLAGGPVARLTFAGGINIRPAWSRDGRWIYYARQDSTGSSVLYKVPADGSALPTPLKTFDNVMVEVLPTADARGFLLRPVPGVAVSINSDILLWRPGVDSAPVPVFTSPDQETGPALSLDGRWLAYTAAGLQSGAQIYVRPFPNSTLGQWQVSFEGGSEPRWSHSGRELFYRDAIGDLIAVEIRTSPTFAIVSRRVLFSTRAYFRIGNHFGYEVMPGDQRFVVLPFGGLDERGGDLILVQHWSQDVARAFQ
ncbi:MAG: protein kinase, partial [Gemmatimonadota bacterium]